MQFATDAMKNMSPEDMANMQKMATQMGNNGGTPAANAMNAPNVMSMLKDPKAMDGMVKMMQNMDEDSLVGMLKMSQPNMDDAAARKAAQSMKGFDEKSMKMAMQFASTLHGAGERVQNAKAYLLARPGVLVAGVFLILALLLRYFGVL